MARTGRPPGRGPCLDQPCPNLGQAGSGLCRTHYKARWLRDRRFKRVVGTELTFSAVHDAAGRLEARDLVALEALGAIDKLFAGLARGELIVIRNGARTQRLKGVVFTPRFRARQAP